MVRKILILGKRSLKNNVCSHFPVSILRFCKHICYIKHFKDYNTKLDHAELLPLSIHPTLLIRMTSLYELVKICLLHRHPDKACLFLPELKGICITIRQV